MLPNQGADGAAYQGYNYYAGYAPHQHSDSQQPAQPQAAPAPTNSYTCAPPLPNEAHQSHELQPPIPGTYAYYYSSSYHDHAYQQPAHQTQATGQAPNEQKVATQQPSPPAHQQQQESASHYQDSTSWHAQQQSGALQSGNAPPLPPPDQHAHQQQQQQQEYGPYIPRPLDLSTPPLPGTTDTHTLNDASSSQSQPPPPLPPAQDSSTSRPEPPPLPPPSQPYAPQHTQQAYAAAAPPPYPCQAPYNPYQGYNYANPYAPYPQQQPGYHQYQQYHQVYPQQYGYGYHQPPAGYGQPHAQATQPHQYGMAYQQPPPAQYAQQQQQAYTADYPGVAATPVEASTGPPSGHAAAFKQNLEALRPVLDLATLLRKPGRASRPARVLLVLRGLPGSGKSHLARRIREVEVEEGDDAPRVHSIDEYFMTEVEKEVEEEGPRGKPRKRVVTEMQYQYDSVMEESYCKSLVKSVSRTLQEGRFKVVIMDAPSMKNAHWLEVLPACTKHRYQVYVAQPLETNIDICAQRNTHGHTRDFIAAMASTWEAPPGGADTAWTVVDCKALLSDQTQMKGNSQISEIAMDQEDNNKQKQPQQQTSSPGDSKGSGSVGVLQDVAEDDDDIDDGGKVSKRSFSSRWGSTTKGDAVRDAVDHGGKDSKGKDRHTKLGGKEGSSSRWDHDDNGGRDGRKGRSSGSSLDGNYDGQDSDKDKERSKKRSKTGPVTTSMDEEILQGINSVLDSFEQGPSHAPTSASKTGKKGGLRSILKKAPGSSGGLFGLTDSDRKRLSWCDQPPELDDDQSVGFRIQPRALPLCTVHVLEGLGPAKGDTALQYMDSTSPLMMHRRFRSFAEQVKAEHNVEHDVLSKTHLHDEPSEWKDEEDTRKL